MPGNPGTPAGPDPSGSPGSDPPAHADRARVGDALMGRTLALVRHLRAGCPWDARQTPESLRPYLLEEAHETAEAILAEDDAGLAGELGDLLLNVVFQIVLAEERGAFDAADVVRGLERKMEARHPHVYGDAEAPPDWEETKARERAESRASAGDGPGDRPPDGATGPDTGAGGDPFHGLPRGTETLARAFRAQQRAAALGFDWPAVEGAIEKLREEIAELEGVVAERRDRTEGPTSSARAGGSVPDARVEAEVGDLLFAAVNVARLLHVHPGPALIEGTRKFERRFREVVRRAHERGVLPEEAPLDELEAIWQEVKREEGETGRDDA